MLNRRRLPLLLLLVSCATLAQVTDEFVVVKKQQEMFKGNASYYADKFHGRRTANGEIYHRDSMTCAHLRLPFGTLLKVHNPKNGRTVVVRVTDRGPYSKRFTIDVSRAAAKELGIIYAGYQMMEITPITPEELEQMGKPVNPFEVFGIKDLTPLDEAYPIDVWQSDCDQTEEQKTPLR